MEKDFVFIFALTPFLRAKSIPIERFEVPFKRVNRQQVAIFRSSGKWPL